MNYKLAQEIVNRTLNLESIINSEEIKHEKLSKLINELNNIVDTVVESDLPASLKKMLGIRLLYISDALKQINCRLMAELDSDDQCIMEFESEFEFKKFIRVTKNQNSNLN